MSRESTLILLGILVALTPFVGLPLLWRAILLPIFGALVVLIGITLRAHKLARKNDLPETASPEIIAS